MVINKHSLKLWNNESLKCDWNATAIETMETIWPFFNFGGARFRPSADKFKSNPEISKRRKRRRRRRRRRRRKVDSDFIGLRFNASAHWPVAEVRGHFLCCPPSYKHVNAASTTCDWNVFRPSGGMKEKLKIFLNWNKPKLKIRLLQLRPIGA